MTIAMTSFAPAQAGSEIIQACIGSWRDAGMDVVAFNHPDELPLLRDHYDVEFVAVTDTTEAHVGRPCVPISAFLRWAADHDVSTLLVNSDIELDLAPWELQRLRTQLAGGLCYLVRHNYDRSRKAATREPFGIDAFLFTGGDVASRTRSSAWGSRSGTTGSRNHSSRARGHCKQPALLRHSTAAIRISGRGTHGNAAPSSSRGSRGSRIGSIRMRRVWLSPGGSERASTPRRSRCCRGRR